MTKASWHNLGKIWRLRCPNAILEVDPMWWHGLGRNFCISNHAPKPLSGVLYMGKTNQSWSVPGYPELYRTELGGGKDSRISSERFAVPLSLYQSPTHLSWSILISKLTQPSSLFQSVSLILTSNLLKASVLNIHCWKLRGRHTKLKCKQWSLCRVICAECRNSTSLEMCCTSVCVCMGAGAFALPLFSYCLFSAWWFAAHHSIRPQNSVEENWNCKGSWATVF